MKDISEMTDMEQIAEAASLGLPPPPQKVERTSTQKSNRNINYSCTQCKRHVGRGNLKVKRIVFREMGVHGQVVQSRTVDWLCILPQPDGSPSCLEADVAWGQPKLTGSPGMADTKRVQEA